MGMRTKATMPKAVSTANSTSGNTGWVIAQAEMRLQGALTAAFDARTDYAHALAARCHRRRQPPLAMAPGATCTCSPVRRNAPAIATTRSLPVRPPLTSRPFRMRAPRNRDGAPLRRLLVGIDDQCV